MAERKGLGRPSFPVPASPPPAPLPPSSPPPKTPEARADSANGRAAKGLAVAAAGAAGPGANGLVLELAPRPTSTSPPPTSTSKNGLKEVLIDLPRNALLAGAGANGLLETVRVQEESVLRVLPMLLVLCLLLLLLPPLVLLAVLPPPPFLCVPQNFRFDGLPLLHPFLVHVCRGQ